MTIQNAIPVDDSEDEEVQIIASPNRLSHDEDLFCMFCNVDLNKYAPEDRQRHYNDHLSDLNTLPPPRPSSGSRPRFQPSHVERSPTKGIFLNTADNDRFWYHSLGVEPPSNYTPGLIPLLKKALMKSMERGATCRAVLCYERAVHIYHELWDASWGCGHRNFMMLCAALVDQHRQPRYSSLLSNPRPPGVKNLTVWIEEAWKAGFDPEGAEGFNGKLVGRRKWVGTAELYVALTYRGIPAQLADFDTPNGNVTPLLDWIKRYFDAPSQDQPTSVQERWRVATPVVISNRMPLILQHPGHSRTIVGYEIERDGCTTLLAFDPSVRMTKIRDTALSSFNSSNQRGTHPSDSKHSSARHRLASAPTSAHPSSSKRAGPPPAGGSPKRLRAGSIEEDVVVVEDSRAAASSSKSLPEHRNSGHRVAAEKEAERTGKRESEKMLEPKKVLGLFRVNRTKLAKKKKYQVLWCPMEDPLTEPDKQARREVTSEQVG